MPRRYRGRYRGYEPDGLTAALNIIVGILALPIGLLVWLFGAGKKK